MFHAYITQFQLHISCKCDYHVRNHCRMSTYNWLKCTQKNYASEIHRIN